MWILRPFTYIAAVSVLVASASAWASASSTIVGEPLRVQGQLVPPPPAPVAINPNPDPLRDDRQLVIPEMPQPVFGMVRRALSSGVLQSSGLDRHRLLQAGGQVALEFAAPARSAGEQAFRQLLETHPWQTALIAGGAAALGAAAFVGVAAHNHRSVTASDTFSVGATRVQIGAGCDFATGEWHGSVGLDLSNLAEGIAGLRRK